jgi:hypothetical protein
MPGRWSAEQGLAGGGGKGNGRRSRRWGFLLLDEMRSIFLWCRACGMESILVLPKILARHARVWAQISHNLINWP